MEQPPPPPPPRHETYDFAWASYTPATGAVTVASTIYGVHRFSIPELVARYPAPSPVPAPTPVPASPPPPPPPSPASESDESDPEEDEGYQSDDSADSGPDVDYILVESEVSSPATGSDMSEDARSASR